jgi:hypothetical protein
MIDINTFEVVRNRFGHYASWAVWAECGINSKDNIADLGVLDPEANPALLDTLHTNAILIGLNISRPIDRLLGNFHDPRPVATDFKICHALRGTPYWGAYMTDIIKDFEEKVSGKMVAYLKRDPEFEMLNVRRFKDEMNVLGCSHPILVAFGKDAERVIRRNFGDSYDVVGIPHYANYVSKENYRRQVWDILQLADSQWC